MLAVITTGPIHVVEVVSSIVVMLVVMVAIVGLQVSCKINLNGSSSGSVALVVMVSVAIKVVAVKWLLNQAGSRRSGERTSDSSIFEISRSEWE